MLLNRKILLVSDEEQVPIEIHLVSATLAHVVRILEIKLCFRRR
jgi:hypothetical protein